MRRTTPVLYLLFSIFHLCVQPLQGQEPATQMDQRSTEIRALVDRGQLAEALPLARELIRLLQAHPTLTELEHVVALYALAVRYHNSNDLGTAEPLYYAALEGLRRITEPEDSGLTMILDRLASLHRDRGDPSAAEPLLREVLEIQRKTLGTDHLDYQTTLSTIATVMVEQGRHADAEPFLREGLDIARRTRGTESPEYTTVLLALAIVLSESDNTGEARPLLREAIELLPRVLGKDHLIYAEALHRYAKVMDVAEEYPALESLFHEALETQRHTPGREYPGYAKLLTGLGLVLVAQKDYEGAEKIYRELIEVRRYTVGSKDPEYALALYFLASMVELRADYAAAEELLREAIEILRENFGTGFEAYTMGLDQLARILYSRGDYRGAEALFHERKELIAGTLGTEHPDYATTLNFLGLLLSARGDFASAEQVHREALAIRARTVGTDHLDYSQSIHNLARTLAELGDHAAAITLYHEALEIMRKISGTESPVYAQTLNNLAMVLYLQRDYPAAEKLHREALEIRRRVVGTSHPTYAESLNNVAAILLTNGDYQGAEPLLLEALEVQFRTLGDDHPGITYTLTNLAHANLMLGRPDSALIFMERVLETEQRTLEQIFGFTSERGMLAFANSLHGSLSTLLSMIDHQPDDDATSAVFRWVLLRKGAVLSALSTYRQVERAATADPEIASAISRLQDTRRQLTTLALNPPVGVEPDSVSHIFTILNTRREALEAGLTRSLSTRLKGNDLLAGRDEEPSSTDLGLENLRRILPQDGALIEFVRFNRLDLDPTNMVRRPSTPHYAALILRTTGPVQWVPLGEADEVELAIRGLRAAHMGCESGERSHFCSESSYRAAAEEAYLRIFDSLEPFLEGARHLIAALEGELNQVPLGALVDLEGRYLIERFRISYVSSGRDLIRRGAPVTRNGGGTLVFAGPTFDLTPSAARPAVDAHGNAGTPANAEGSALPDALRSLKWEELPGALAEANDVQSTLQGTPHGPVTIRTGVEATETALKTSSPPRILHLATHGFFIPERDLTPEERAACLAQGSGPAQQLDLETGMGRGIERLRCAENPLLRSGIVLAGANAIGTASSSMTIPGAAATADTLPSGDAGTTTHTEDGWVLAEEITALDLSGTELVILSACETGLGDVRTGEGVYGLRRAFELAGARQILMSLFKVPDTATRELLGGFYRRLAAGSSAEDALRESQLELRQKHPHPFFWASFVLVGAGQ